MKDNKKNSIDELLIKNLTDFATDSEKVELEKWLSLNEENQNYFNKFKSVWELSSNVKEYQEIDTESSLKNVKKRIDFNTKPKTKVKALWMAIRIAAILVLFFGLYFIFSNKGATSDTFKMVKVESPDKIKVIVLPDSTVVTLNLASVIEYPENFEGKERRVKFKGEAYFEVTPNKLKPFIIETNKSETKVVGTAFNLKAIANNETESIVVTEGIVEFSGKTESTKKAVLIEKGGKATLNSELKKEKNTNPNFMAWKTGVFVFDNQNLVESLQELSEFYHVKFKIQDTVLTSYTLNGRYEKLSINELVEILEMTLDIKVEKQGEIYWLKN